MAYLEETECHMSFWNDSKGTNQLHPKACHEMEGFSINKHGKPFQISGSDVMIYRLCVVLHVSHRNSIMHIYCLIITFETVIQRYIRCTIVYPRICIFCAFITCKGAEIIMNIIIISSLNDSDKSLVFLLCYIGMLSLTLNLCL